MRQRRALLPLVLVAGATVVLITWAVLMLQGEGPPTAPPRAAPPAGPPASPPRSMEVAPVPAAANDEPVPQPEALAVPLATPEPPSLGPAAVFGRVLDATTGQPVVSFQVTVLTHEAGDPLARLEQAEPQPFHRREGVFQVDQEPGVYDVVVVAPGYLPTSISGVEVPAKGLDPLDYRLDRGPGIAGRVFDETGTGASGIKLFLQVRELRDPGAPHPRVGVTTTNLDGSFSFSPLPPGEYAISALRPENEFDRVAGIRVYDGTTNVDLYLTPRHVVTLKLRDENGRPVARARITLRSAEHFATALSNPSGLAVLHYVPDGRYTLTASADGFHELSEAIELYGGMSDEVRFYTMQKPLDG